MYERALDKSVELGEVDICNTSGFQLDYYGIEKHIDGDKFIFNLKNTLLEPEGTIMQIVLSNKEYIEIRNALDVIF